MLSYIRKNGCFSGTKIYFIFWLCKSAKYIGFSEAIKHPSDDDRSNSFGFNTIIYKQMEPTGALSGWKIR
jgi:hypothetical protein